MSMLPIRISLPLLAALACGPDAWPQLATRTADQAAPTAHATPHRTRLYLKDGSYQVVMGWVIQGKNVQYTSAERGGEKELIPLALVDLDATNKWESAHMPIDPDAPPSASRPAPAIDPELLKEEAERALVTPEVAPDLRLAPVDAVLALDTFRATPELVPLTQTDGELNKQTGHSILRGIVKPQSAPHQLIVLKGEKAAVQMHVPDPVFFFKLDDALLDNGPALTVDTHGASSAAAAPARRPQARNPYVIVRVDVRQDARVLASFNMAQLGTGRRQEDVFETTSVSLPGGHWLRVTPKEPLLVGEYAMVEVLDGQSLNLGVWDFGIHPTAAENRDVLKPETKHPIRLERRERP